jgi:hypothetical protein
MIIHKLKLITFKKRRISVYMYVCLYIISSCTPSAALKVNSTEQMIVLTHLVKKLPNFWNLSVDSVFTTAHH